MRSLSSVTSLVVFVCILCGMTSNASGVLIVNGKTATVGNGFTGDHSGSHFHSVTDPSAPAISNPTIGIFSAAEVGGFLGDEEVQGISEFTLQAGAADTVLLMFDVRDNSDIDFENPIGGLFGQGPFNGFIDVYAYEADHVESVSDFVALADRPTDPPLLSIEVAPGLIAPGDTFSVDITSTYNDFVSQNDPALGIRLLSRVPNPTAPLSEQLEALEEAGAITFHDFRLQLTNPTGVPEPSPALFLGLVCLTLSGVSRYRRGIFLAD